MLLKHVVILYHNKLLKIMETFGEYIKSLRISKQITLRDFCKKADLDPSNWSKIERGISPPPKSTLVLTSIAHALNISDKSEEYNTLYDLAAISHIPKELVTDKEIFEKLPVFFRTARGDSPNRKELEKLFKLIKEE